MPIKIHIKGQPMRKFEVNIRGNDVFNHTVDVLAKNFKEAVTKAEQIMSHLASQTIEILDISSIAELED